jgi:hypothetical protein
MRIDLLPASRPAYQVIGGWGALLLVAAGLREVPGLGPIVTPVFGAVLIYAGALLIKRAGQS